jgi:hypothetical protein
MQSAQAFEGGVSPFPTGSTSEYIAALPPIPGLFAVEQFNYSSADGLYDNKGNKRPIPFKSDVFSATTRLLASYGVEWLGAKVYSQLVLPVVSLHTEVAGQGENHNGLSNVTVTPLLLRWDVAAHTNVTFGFDFALKTGSYDPPAPAWRWATPPTSRCWRSATTIQTAWTWASPTACSSTTRTAIPLPLRHCLRGGLHRWLELRQVESRRHRFLPEPVHR